MTISTEPPTKKGGVEGWILGREGKWISSALGPLRQIDRASEVKQAIAGARLPGPLFLKLLADLSPFTSGQARSAPGFHRQTLQDGGKESAAGPARQASSGERPQKRVVCVCLLADSHARVLLDSTFRCLP